MNPRILAVLCSTCGVIHAQPPAIGQNGVVNAASRIPGTLPGASIAPGTRFEITGVRLTKSNTARVKIEHNGYSKFTAILRAEPKSVEALMPSDVPPGHDTLVVETEAGRSKPFPVEVASTRVGLYSVNRQGWGQGKIDLFDQQRRTPNSLTKPARPGQLAAILSTGLGDGRFVSMVVGGQATRVVGISRNIEPGVDEIRFRIPSTALEGCYVPLYALSPGAPPSNIVTISIASPAAPCRLPGGGAALRIQGAHHGVIGMGRTALLYADDGPRTTLDEAYALFLDSSNAANQTPPLLSAPPEGSCTAYTGSYQSGAPGFRSFPDALLAMLEGRGMNAGRALSIGGGRETRTIPATGRGAYWARLGMEEPGLHLNRPLFLKSGTYVFSSVGGPDVDQFARNISSPGPIEWLNEREAASVDRNRGLTVKWRTGAGANLVLIFAVSVDPLTTATAMCLCSAKPEAGRIRIPKEVFSYFPKTQDIPGPPGSLLFAIAARLETAVPPAVRGLDDFLTISTVTEGRRVLYH